MGQYPYCLGGGDIYGPTPGWGDPESDGSYSTCWNETHPNLPAKYGFDSTGLTRYVVYRGTGKQLTHDSFQAKFSGGDPVAGKAELFRCLMPRLAGFDGRPMAARLGVGGRGGGGGR